MFRTIKNSIRQVAFVAAAALTAAAFGADAQPKFEVFPSDVHLFTARSEQSLVCRVVQPDGVTREVTDQVQWVAPDSLIKMDHNVARPIGDGKGELKVKYQGQEITVPVEVKDAKVDRPISFRLDVMPIFMRAGCNVGSCHGSARGKDGFHLSLFGYDPEGDYDRLTRELSTRRINLAIPKESLLIQKGLGAVPHTGGTRFHEGDDLYNTLMRWIEAGAPNDDVSKVAVADQLEILPKQIVLEGENTKQQLTIRAHYSDGTVRDVTHMALFMSNNDNSATVTPDGLITSAKRGEAFVMARFATFTVGSQVIVIPKGINYTFPNLPEYNYVDQLVDAKLKKLRLEPSPICTDEVFLRRAYSDIIGLLPTREEHDRFMASQETNKREKLVDELLGRKEFVELWVMKFAELLKIRSDNQESYKAALLYYNWLEDKLSHNVPMNEIVQDLLDSTGGTFKNPATNYFELERDPLKLAEDTAQVFMGMRIQCAQCHNHPFDRWTMQDYYGFAAFFSQIGRKQAEDPREQIVYSSGGGEVANPLTKKVAHPTFLGGGEADTKGKDRREVLGKWLASPDNPYFAKNLANIVWAHFLGKGIVEPVDDVRISNPPVNPELLDTLGTKFQEYHYDFKHLVRDICTSRVYQTATETNASNAGDDRNFAHGTIRRMRAEVLLDMLSEVTNTPEKFRGLPVGARAVEIADGTTTDYFLRTFGRATRLTACSCEVKMDPNLSQALHLLNGQTVHRKLGNSTVVSGMLAEKKSPEEIVDDLYIRCFSRKPTADEKNAIVALLPKDDDKNKAADTKAVLDDLFWALLNSEEFMFNH